MVGSIASYSLTNQIEELIVWSGVYAIIRQTFHIVVDYKNPVYLKDITVSIGIGMLNKAQGQTFSEVGTNMQRPCFSHEQLYIAWRFADVKELNVVEHALPIV